MSCPDCQKLVVLVIILLYSFTSEGYDSNNSYHHPLLQPSDFSNSFQKGRARIWKYEHDTNLDDTSTVTCKDAESKNSHRHRDQNKGSVNPLNMLLASTTATDHRSSFTTKNNHQEQSSNPSAEDVNENELQLTLQNQLPPGKYRASPSFPIDHIHGSYRKTGTTIVGCLAQNTLILAADTRATEGTIVADKMCEKVHCLAKNVWACGAGTSGDLDALVKKVRYTFLLRGLLEESVGNGNVSHNSGSGSDHFLSDEERSIGIAFPNANIAAICRFIRDELYSGGGEIGANLVLGGFDQSTQKAILVAIHPHGSMDLVPYTALGSGGLAAMGVLESRFRTDMTVEEALELVKDAVHAGIKNDLGSGSQIDISVISASGVQYTRGVVKEEELILSTEDKNVAEDLYMRHISSENNDAVMDGVNGFGSLPYWIKSCKLIIESEENIEQARNKWLDNMLKG